MSEELAAFEAFLAETLTLRELKYFFLPKVVFLSRIKFTDLASRLSQLQEQYVPSLGSILSNNTSLTHLE